eukprot:CAMPEP_0119318312 /NCGR_PEP_ID=MMETSP1333-20130426/46027_1 /TAXON_ID=418940 /ORGANISM="Scyphosphaera apsteinii, Strain RCC1455" /LENGTH=407 /DNA_ID=CAMNT_0007324457 /DNA_START=22 /DNA_END=1245 /DNA_ORIENTATION=-
MSSSAKTYRVFVYGSLMRGLHNHHFIERATFHHTTKTRDTFCLIDSGSSFPYAISTNSCFASQRSKPTAITGELWSVKEPILDSLDRLEGHPDFYRRREIELEDDDEVAWMYFLYDPKFLKMIEMSPERYPDVIPPGDWRTYYPPGTWRDTMMTCGTAGPHTVFCYGSNGIEQMRERCRNPKLTARKARLPGSIRVFGGWSSRWGGAVASVLPKHGHSVRGSIVDLSAEELALLDSFEAVKSSKEPYAREGAVYHRQDVIVLAESDGDQQTPIPAVMYVKTDLEWKGPPSAKYLAACVRNVAQFWQPAKVEVRDGHGMLRGAPQQVESDTAPVDSSSAREASSSSAAGVGTEPSLTVDAGSDGVIHFDVVASRTEQTLVEAFGFPIDKAVTAVDAIVGKSDINLAVE